MAKKRLTKEEIVKRNKRIRRKLRGLIFVFFALVGVCTVAYLGVRGIAALLDDTKEREAYAAEYTTLVALDPMPFDLNTSAPEEVLMEAAIWAVINNENLDKYPRTAAGALLLPAVDVGIYASRMFGSAYTIEHKTFTGIDLEYVYDITTNMYTMPLTGFSSSFFPEVSAITTSGSTRVLTVAYYLTSSLTGFGESDEPYKYMEYVLLKEDGEYRLVAVRDPQLDGSTN